MGSPFQQETRTSFCRIFARPPPNPDPAMQPSQCSRDIEPTREASFEAKEPTEEALSRAEVLKLIADEAPPVACPGHPCNALYHGSF